MPLFPKSIPYQARTGSYVLGVWTNTTPTDGTLMGSVQPMTGKEVEALGIGRLDIGHVKVYSDIRLNTSEEGSSTPGDVVISDGKRWEVIKELPYGNGLINHFKYVAQYIGEAS